MSFASARCGSLLRRAHTALAIITAWLAATRPTFHVVKNDVLPVKGRHRVLFCKWLIVDILRLFPRKQDVKLRTVKRTFSPNSHNLRTGLRQKGAFLKTKAFHTWGQGDGQWWLCDDGKVVALTELEALSKQASLCVYAQSGGDCLRLRSLVKLLPSLTCKLQRSPSTSAGTLAVLGASEHNDMRVWLSLGSKSQNFCWSTCRNRLRFLRILNQNSSLTIGLIALDAYLSTHAENCVGVYLSNNRQNPYKRCATYCFPTRAYQISVEWKQRYVIKIFKTI